VSIRVKPSSVAIRMISLVVMISCLAVTMPAQSEGKSAPAVELKCRIIGNPGDPPRLPWMIELRDALGRPIRRALHMVGDTIRFKNLLPGVYRIHLSGIAGRRSSESIDLNLAPKQRSLLVSRDIKVPKSASPAARQYQVSARELAVPREALLQMQRSDRAQFEGNTSEMVGCLKRAIELCPDFAEAWNNLGAHYHRQGDFEQSIRCFSRVTELNPEFYVGWMNLGGSLLAAGKFKESVVANRKALTLGPDDAIAASQLGLSHYYLHEYAEARKCFLRVLALDPGFPDAPHLFLAQMAIAEKSYGEAREYLVSFLALHPNAPNAAQVKEKLAIITGAEAGPASIRR
jgi:tetratricopeptide (TPR) repeat protein